MTLRKIAIFSRALILLLISLSLVAPIIPAIEAQTNKQTARQAQTVQQWPDKVKRWALVIGVNEYIDKANFTRLEAGVNDARALRDALVKYAGFPGDQVILLTSDQPESLQPTRSNILGEMERLKNQVQKDGLLLIAFSGHGKESNGQLYLATSDTRANDLEDTAWSAAKITDDITATGVQQVVLLLDACRKNDIGRGDESLRLTRSQEQAFNFHERAKSVRAFVTLYATGLGEVSRENPDTKMGFFTEAIVEGLRGGAADSGREVTLGNLVRFVKQNVPERTRRAIREDQKPSENIYGYRADEVVIAEPPPPPDEKITFEKMEAVPFKPQRKGSPKLENQRRGVLFVLVNQPQAHVIIKDKRGVIVKEGPCAGEFRAELLPDIYDVDVYSVNCHPYSAEASVEKAQEENMIVELSPLTGSILIDSVEADMNVLIDGQPPAGANAKRSGKQLELLNVLAGSHSVKITHRTIADWKREIEVRSGTRTRVTSPRFERATDLGFQDQFKDGGKSWALSSGWDVRPGSMIVQGTGAGLIREKVYRNFRMIFDVVLENDQGVGWVVRAQDDKNYYRFVLYGPKSRSKNIFRGFVYKNGEATQLVPDYEFPKDLIRSNSVINIVVEVKGNTIEHRIQIDSGAKERTPQQVVIYTDSSFSQGLVGFETDAGMRAKIQYVSVTPIE